MANQLHEEPPGGFSYLGQELYRRTCTPLRHVTFCVYAFMAIIVFGLLSVWLEVVQLFLQSASQDDSALRTSIITFFPALAGPAAIQLLFSNDAKKPLRSFALFVGILLAIAAAVLQLYKGLSASAVYFLAIVACFISIWFWLVATGQDPAFRDDVNIDASVGGPPETTPLGDLSGFKV